MKSISMSTKQHYVAPVVDVLLVKTEGVIMLSQQEVINVLSLSTIDSASYYSGETETAIKW